ncbi:GtrA family protein [Halegenticoccus tardaugens]|uniref:GtrA family protein n=1 Tax=Halegenticoccus tardaugens TaxID=2071624 RepID=UPI00100AFC66|nr:GtrA family protein [Halegenticoccus tardaugens]
MNSWVDELASGVRVGQFASVGAVGAVVDTATVVALTSWLGVYRGSAKLVGAELAIVLMFLLNENWTFASEGGGGLRGLLWRFGKSNLVRAGGVLVATVVFVHVSGLDVRLPVGGEGLWLVAANGVGIAAGTLVNYVAESLFTWRVAAVE